MTMERPSPRPDLYNLSISQPKKRLAGKNARHSHSCSPLTNTHATIMKLFKKFDAAGTPPLTDLSNDSTDREKRSGSLDESRVPWVTWRSVCLGAFVSIGGVIFGYDTGQISGFLEMRNFKQRFGQLQPDGTWRFSNVRSGLIVSMVSDCLVEERTWVYPKSIYIYILSIYLSKYLTFS